MYTHSPRRSGIRLTRRGRLTLIVTGAAAAVAAAAIVVPSALSGGDESPKALTVQEGWRAAQIYPAVDRALGTPAGTTAKSLAKAKLKLPAAAEGNPEGFLYPGTYPLSDKSTSASLLRAMVANADRAFGGAPVAAGAQRNAMNPYQAVVIASLVQTEADTKADMGKVARVIYNRLDRGMPLKLDSTVNYALHRGKQPITPADARTDSLYNTYARMGLPPTPIANPGKAALRAATSPPSGDWLYFVTVKKGETRFTASADQHAKDLTEARHGEKPATRTH
ncbi:endolytic transglycosylase MltG [Streptomyces sp. NPDC058045]|uniref:endolytic transglycosylase MltG n=1 Tax=Streptomyces sp. NPDC058045 TaxID=3346311 RepID=UPI0036E873EC